VHHAKYPLRHSTADILAQLQVARDQLSKIATHHGGLAYVMEERIAALERKTKFLMKKNASASGGASSSSSNFVSLGFDYLVVAEKKKQ
jgi:hypothetical protein